MYTDTGKTNLERREDFMYRQRSTGWMKHWDFILLDLIALHLSFVIAYWVRHGIANPYLRQEYQEISLVLLCTDLIILFFMESLRGVIYRGYWKELVKCVQSAVLITLVTTWYLFSIKAGAEYSRLVCYMTGGFYVIFNYGFRIGWKHVLKNRGMSRPGTVMLVAGERESIGSVLESLEKNSYGLSKIIGVVLLDGGSEEEKSVGNYPVVANIRTMEDFVCRNWVDELMIVKRNTTWIPELRSIVDRIAEAGVAVHNVLDFEEESSGVERIVEQVDGYPVLTSVIKSVTFRQAFFKRALDIAGGLVGSLMAILALLIVGPIIYIQSPGPIVFKQQRVGRNGKLFTMYKIRSMDLDADDQKQKLMERNRVSDGMMFKLDFDPRIIGAKQLPDGTIKKGIGNYIRDWSIDELPQFWNVLKGDMSLVGTRPPTLDEWNKYELHHRARMAFRPGITGMWQISGRSKITDFEEVVKLDMKYITGWTPGLDMRILIQTIGVVLKRKGAM